MRKEGEREERQCQGGAPNPIALAQPHPTSRKNNLSSPPSDPAVRAAIATIRAVASGGPDRPPPAEVLAAILTLEKAKLPPAPLFGVLTGGQAGRRWRLTYTAGAAAAKAAMKAGGVAQGGSFGSAGTYIPITAVQRWAADEASASAAAAASTSSGSASGAKLSGTIENGIFLGWLGAFIFSGTFTLDGRRLPFDLDGLRLRVGPKTFSFPFSTKKKGGGEKATGPGPFFLVAYADDAAVVARGASGGVAVWARAGDEWCARAGVDA